MARTGMGLRAGREPTCRPLHFLFASLYFTSLLSGHTSQLISSEGFVCKWDIDIKIKRKYKQGVKQACENNARKGSNSRQMKVMKNTGKIEMFVFEPEE